MVREETRDRKRRRENKERERISLKVWRVMDDKG